MKPSSRLAEIYKILLFPYSSFLLLFSYLHVLVVSIVQELLLRYLVRESYILIQQTTRSQFTSTTAALGDSQTARTATATLPFDLPHPSHGTEDRLRPHDTQFLRHPACQRSLLAPSSSSGTSVTLPPK